MTIREATLTDIDAIVAMSLHFLGLVYAGLIHASPDALATYARFLVTNPDAVVWLAERDGIVIGMLGLLAYTHPMSGESTVTEVMWWVTPEARGCGVKLFRLAERWAKDRGATVLQMIAPTPAVEQFYTRQGYAPVERIYQRRLA